MTCFAADSMLFSWMETRGSINEPIRSFQPVCVDLAEKLAGRRDIAAVPMARGDMEEEPERWDGLS